MKVIKYRGGIVTFSVPENWIEEYEPDGGGMFYEDAPNTGTFRINVLTAMSPIRVNQLSAYQALAGLRSTKPESIKNLPNGNAISSWVQESSEGGFEITIYWWHVANPVEPFHMRVANFSFTVLTSKRNVPSIQSEVDMLQKSIEEAVFHPTLD